MIKKTVILLFLILISCQQLEKEEAIEVIENSFKPKITSEEVLDILNNSYDKKDTNRLIEFLVDWNKSIKPNSRSIIHENSIISTVYDIFYKVYKPYNLLDLGDWEWGNKLNYNSQFAIIQNNISFSITDKSLSSKDINLKEIESDTIKNFRPKVNIDHRKVLYLTNQHREGINKFLGYKNYKMGEGNIMNPSTPRGESEERYRFLRKYLPILHGHWGNYWHLETHPEISLILLNETLNNAKVYFRVGYQGGEANLVKRFNMWFIKESKETWIE